MFSTGTFLSSSALVLVIILETTVPLKLPVYGMMLNKPCVPLNKPIDIAHIMELTHLSLNKTAATWQTTFSNAFSWLKSFFFFIIRISLKFVPKGPIDNKSALIQVMALHSIGNKPLPKPMLNEFTDVYVALRGDELTYHWWVKPGAWCLLMLNIMSLWWLQ